jgi:hypothetical protein
MTENKDNRFVIYLIEEINKLRGNENPLYSYLYFFPMYLFGQVNNRYELGDINKEEKDFLEVFINVKRKKSFLLNMIKGDVPTIDELKKIYEAYKLIE